MSADDLKSKNARLRAELGHKTADLKKYAARIDDLEARQDLFGSCLRRALKLWKAEHPSSDYWPDGAENIAWVMGTAERERDERLKAIEREQAALATIAGLREALVKSQNILRAVQGNYPINLDDVNHLVADNFKLLESAK
jgi:hypothetical protein